VSVYVVHCVGNSASSALNIWKCIWSTTAMWAWSRRLGLETY